MKFGTKLLLATALTAASSTTAQAQESEVDALKSEIAELKAALEALSARVEAQSNQNTQTKTQVEAVKETADEAKAAAENVVEIVKEAEEAPFDIKWKGAPQFNGKGGWSFKPRGRIQVDAASVTAPDGVEDPGLGFSNSLRRVRLGAQGNIPGGFGYKVYGDIAGGGFTLNDAFFDYTSNGFSVIIGHFNGYQSLEELTSSNDNSFIERAAFTDAFNFERRVGLGLTYDKGDILIQTGVFTDNNEDLADDGNNSFGFDGRIVYTPVIGEARLHLGGSAHWRDLGSAITTTSFDQRPLVNTSDTRFVDTGDILNAEQEVNFGLESAVILNRFHAAAEAHWFRVNRSELPNTTFFGGSVEAGLYLTDDTRQYKAGYFDGIDVKNPLSEGGIGAVQINARYDRLDLTDQDIIGGTQDSLQLSLIWNPESYVRFLLNYAYLDYTDVPEALANGIERDFGVHTVGVRAQLNW